MTLKSGADVKIGAYEFFLDDTAQEPYSHVLVSLYSDSQKIPGMDATTADPNVLPWPYDDFAGGTENKYYSELIPDTWWYGNANPRVRGSITAPPDTTHKVHQPFAAAGTYAGIAASDNSIVYFTASNGTTEVFEYRFSSATNSFIPRPIWKPSPGFTGRYLICTMGVYYVLGDYVDQAAIFGMSSINREPLFLSYVGQAFGANGVGLTPTSLAPSYGTSVLIGMTDGTTNYYFVYDAEIDALTPLDQQTVASEGSQLAIVTYKNRRVAFACPASTAGKPRYWKQDFDTPTRSWEWVSSAWNVGYPMDEKLLFGFEVVCDPTIAAGTIQVLYQIDESGTWVSAGTTVAGVKYTNIDISASNVKYRNLRMRMLSTNGARCFSMTARNYINSYQEIWRLVVKMRDENPNDRPRTRQAKAARLRTWLNELAKNKNVVTFLDGRVDPTKGKFSTNRVVVEFVPRGGQRIARAQGHYEGAAEIQLRSTVPVSTS